MPSSARALICQFEEIWPSSNQKSCVLITLIYVSDLNVLFNIYHNWRLNLNESSRPHKSTPGHICRSAAVFYERKWNIFSIVSFFFFFTSLATFGALNFHRASSEWTRRALDKASRWVSYLAVTRPAKVKALTHKHTNTQVIQVEQMCNVMHAYFLPVGEHSWESLCIKFSVRKVWERLQLLNLSPFSWHLLTCERNHFRFHNSKTQTGSQFKPWNFTLWAKCFLLWEEEDVLAFSVNVSVHWGCTKICKQRWNGACCQHGREQVKTESENKGKW